MSKLRCVHLNDDFSMGGVVKALGVFDLPDLARLAASEVKRVIPRGLAPKLEADMIVTHFPPSWSALPFLISLRARNPRARLVHIEHSYTGSWEAHCVPAKARFRLMLKLAYRLFDEVIAVSHGQAEWLRRHGLVPARKLVVINPWSGSEALSSLAFPAIDAKRTLRLGAIGRFAYAKGFDTLIEAMRRLPSERFELMLAGAGPEEEGLRHLARDLPNVSFVGKVDLVAAFYDSCDVVVVPSRWEAFGLVAAEARQAGRPVLVADVDGLTEQAARGGLATDCSEPARLARAIDALTCAPLAEMAVEARQAMANAEADRIAAWGAVFGRVLAKRSDSRKDRAGANR